MLLGIVCHVHIVIHGVFAARFPSYGISVVYCVGFMLATCGFGDGSCDRFVCAEKCIYPVLLGACVEGAFPYDSHAICVCKALLKPDLEAIAKPAIQKTEKRRCFYLRFLCSILRLLRHFSHVDADCLTRFYSYAAADQCAFDNAQTSNFVVDVDVAHVAQTEHLTSIRS